MLKPVFDKTDDLHRQIVRNRLAEAYLLLIAAADSDDEKTTLEPVSQAVSNVVKATTNSQVSPKK